MSIKMTSTSSGFYFSTDYFFSYSVEKESHTCLLQHKEEEIMTKLSLQHETSLNAFQSAATTRTHLICILGVDIELTALFRSRNSFPYLS